MKTMLTLIASLFVMNTAQANDAHKDLIRAVQEHPVAAAAFKMAKAENPNCEFVVHSIDKMDRFELSYSCHTPESADGEEGGNTLIGVTGTYWGEGSAADVDTVSITRAG